MSVQREMWEARELKVCSYIYGLDDCDFEDSAPRPGDTCTNDADEGCEQHRCAAHCSCAAHHREDDDD